MSMWEHLAGTRRACRQELVPVGVLSMGGGHSGASRQGWVGGDQVGWELQGRGGTMGQGGVLWGRGHMGCVGRGGCMGYQA